MRRYIERCVPTIERYIGLVRTKRDMDAAQMEVTRVWAKVAKIVVKWVEDLKQTMEEAIQVESEIQYPKSHDESLRDFRGKF